jgi:hypothetical protein
MVSADRHRTRTWTRFKVKRILDDDDQQYILRVNDELCTNMHADGQGEKTGEGC